MAKVIVVGSLNVDQISYTPKLPEPGETILGSRYEVGCGGKESLFYKENVFRDFLHRKSALTKFVRNIYRTKLTTPVNLVW